LNTRKREGNERDERDKGGKRTQDAFERKTKTEDA